MAAEIDRVMQRAWRYWYEDGLVELAAGLLFLLVGLVFAVEALLPHLAAFSAFALPVVVVGGMVLARWALGALKSRLVFPRTGYVSYRRVGRRRRLLTAMVGGAMAAGLSSLIVTVPAARSWIPALQGMVVGLAWLWVGHSIGLLRYYVLGALSAGCGLLLAFLGLGEISGSALYYSVQGLAMAGSGGVALHAYLRQSRDQVGEDDNGH
ncbi:MAG: hypothetical protein ACUVX9_09555 [Anaerolineae bacterium]